MNCINRAELELYLKGKLDIERLLAVDAHLSTCTSCKTALQGLPAQQKAGAALGANLLGLQDCPEYEAMSAYVDGTLDPAAAGTIAVHANFCEECARDIARIEELRAHASMREMIEVFPGASRQASRPAFGYWKQAIAILSGAAVLAVVALSVGQFGSKPNNPSRIADNSHSTQYQQPADNGGQLANKPEDNKPVPPQNNTNNPSTNGNLSANTDQGNTIQQPRHKTPNRPGSQYATVLKDGDYSVVRRHGKYEMAKADGAPVRTELEARIAASIREKLRTGKIKQAESYQTASAEFGVRDPDGVNISAAAPQLKSPVSKVVSTNRPSLTWSASDMAESYLVTIYDRKSGRIVMEETTKDNTFTPSEPLARGMVYKWRVGVRFNEGDDWTQSKAETFSVLSAEDFTTIQKLKAQGSHLALGAAYEYFGLFDEAAAEYNVLAKENPRSEISGKLTVKK